MPAFARPVVTLLALLSCAGPKGSGPSAETDAVGDADSDADADGDADSDADGDSDPHSGPAGHTGPTVHSGAGPTGHTGAPPTGDTASGAACADLRFTAPFQDAGSTVGQGDDVPSCNGDGLGRADVVYEFEAPVEADYLVSATADFPTLVGVYDDCAAPTIAVCDEPVVHLTAGQRVYVVVDGRDPTDPEGTYTLDVAEIPTAEVACADGLDEDRDGALDCTDPDCAADAECAFVCPAGALLLDTPLAGTTLGRRDDLPSSCAYGGGPDEHLSFTAPAAGAYVFETTAADFPSALAVFDGCAGSEFACDDWQGGPQLALVRVFLAANQTVIVAVEGIAGTSGTWTLLARAVPDHEVDCGDALDDDGDGAPDCADDDCTDDPSCVEDCDDGLDNDLDIEFDCDDRDCDPDPACVEVCDDAVDNDGDRREDCLDGFCAGDPSCGAERCGDGADNDRDGYPDCRDPECASDPACPEDCTNGVDDDLDQWTDCDDLRCDDDVACIEFCGDGLDNDGDGRADCADAACATAPDCGPEQCADGLDNDADRDVDCRDADCAFDLACTEDCTNGVDDDGDRPADCDDLFCVYDPACAEVCDNGLDDDGDGTADCYDWACATDPKCVPTPCPTFVWTAAVPGQTVGDNSGAVDVLHSTCHEGGGVDHSYAFTAPADGTYVFDTYGSAVDTTLYVQSACGLTYAPLACVDDVAPFYQSEVSVTLTTGQTVIVVVDQPNGVARVGPYVLNVH